MMQVCALSSDTPESNVVKIVINRADLPAAVPVARGEKTRKHQEGEAFFDADG